MQMVGLPIAPAEIHPSHSRLRFWEMILPKDGSFDAKMFVQIGLYIPYKVVPSQLCLLVYNPH